MRRARLDRVHGAVGVIPSPLWLVLFFIAGVIFVYTLFFADRGERAVVQSLLMGSVASVIVALLLLLYALDHPFQRGMGGLDPVAMERTLRIIDQALDAVGGNVPVPCEPGREPGLAMRLGVDERLEVVATILLSLATLATAWSGYQASRWNGEQAKAFSRANAARIESTKAANLAAAQTQVDVATFTQWVNAYALEQTELADFYFARFREEFKPAVDAWVATRPRRNPDAPLTPFAMPEYRLAARAESARLEADAERWAATARENVQRATNYVLGVVLFGSVLFFAGISTKLGTPLLRRVLLGLGFAIFLVTVIWLATFPVSISI